MKFQDNFKIVKDFDDELNQNESKSKNKEKISKSEPDDGLKGTLDCHRACLDDSLRFGLLADKKNKDDQQENELPLIPTSETTMIRQSKTQKHNQNKMMSKNNLKEENKQLKSENEALKAKLGEFKNVTDPGKVQNHCIESDFLDDQILLLREELDRERDKRKELKKDLEMLQLTRGDKEDIIFDDQIDNCDIGVGKLNQLRNLQEESSDSIEDNKYIMSLSEAKIDQSLQRVLGTVREQDKRQQSFEFDEGNTLVLESVYKHQFKRRTGMDYHLGVEQNFADGPVEEDIDEDPNVLMVVNLNNGEYRVSDQRKQEWTKSNKKCIQFPKCRYRDRCKFRHPEIRCKFGKGCRQRKDCNYIHE